jgi:trehalose 6-phosphate phosphatase
VRAKAEQPGTLGGSASDLQVDEYRIRALQVLRARPAALISDFDGTLSPIVRSPEEAVVLPECRSALRSLAQELDLVAILSGRAVEEARRLVGLDELTYVGNHGLERWDSRGGYESEAEPYRGQMAEVLKALGSELGNMEGVRLEDKGIVITIHYRSSPDAAAARQTILEAAGGISTSTDLTVVEGKKVIEIRPPLAVDKGTAVRKLAEEHRLKGIVCLGDDSTDVDAFRAVKELRQQRGLPGLAIGVGGEEAPVELVSEADVLLPEPEAVAGFLQGLADELSVGAT